jgi:hypothetical protein
MRLSAGQLRAWLLVYWCGIIMIGACLMALGGMAAR